jgi:Glyoxalase/Bleomycin resistance protein/Dioxygenase superfamily
MISYFMFGTNKFEEAVNFYDVLMSEMGAEKAYATENNAGWGWGIGTPMFIVTKPFNQEPATFGNGVMISFDAESPEKVDKLHAKVLELGGTNEGEPGKRGEHMYVAYCRDLDGNKFNFIHYMTPGA